MAARKKTKAAGGVRRLGALLGRLPGREALRACESFLIHLFLLLTLLLALCELLARHLKHLLAP